MEDFKLKVLEWAQANQEKHSLYMFSITWTLVLYTWYVALYLPRFSVSGLLAVLMLATLSTFIFSAFKRFMTEKEADLAFRITKRTIFQAGAFLFVIPVSFIVYSEFTPFVGGVVALALYLIAGVIRRKLDQHPVVMANYQILRDFDFLQGFNSAEMTREQQKDITAARQKAKAQMREDKKARKVIAEANIIEIPTIDNPDLDISPQFGEESSES